jgi:hypothetical protein
MAFAIKGTNGEGAIIEKDVAEVTITYATKTNHPNFGYTISFIILSLGFIFI